MTSNMPTSHPAATSLAALKVRRIAPDDHDAWLPLWAGYNAFYGRVGVAALPQPISAATWQRFFDPTEPVFAHVAECNGRPDWKPASAKL